MASTTKHISFNAIEHRSPVSACQFAGAGGRNPFLNLARPCCFNLAFGVLQAFEQLGGDLCAFVERQFQRLRQQITSSACHRWIVTRPFHSIPKG